MAADDRATLLLQRLEAGDASAGEELLPIVYEELHRLARGAMARERNEHTLQATALVNEAWIRLVDREGARWEGREHFLAVAARAMRSVLVDHARRRAAEKRGGAVERVPLEQAFALFDERAVDILELHEALEELAGVEERAARVVELRFFGGLTNEEAARVLATSLRTVEREWRVARAWLHQRIAGESDGEVGSGAGGG